MYVVNDDGCSWINDLDRRSNIKTLDKDKSCDWLIVGAGYTGLSAARKLSEIHPNQKIIIVDDISDRRRGAPEAQKLYHETEDSVKKREEMAWQRKTMQAAQLPPARRPSKKDRRDIQRFREQNGL